MIIVSNALPLRCTSTSYPYEFEWDEDSLLYQARNGISVCGSEGTPTVMFIGQLGIDIEGRYQDVRALFASRPSLTSLSRPNALFFERACSVAYGCTMHLLALMAACTSKLWVMHTL